MGRVDREAVTLTGRREWTPEATEPVDIPTDPKEKSYFTKCIQRDRLASCIYEEVKEKYSNEISVEFEVECIDASWMTQSDTEMCCLTLQQKGDGTGPDKVFNIEAPFVVGAGELLILLATIMSAVHQPA